MQRKHFLIILLTIPFVDTPRVKRSRKSLSCSSDEAFKGIGVMSETPEPEGNMSFQLENRVQNEDSHSSIVRTSVSCSDVLNKTVFLSKPS